jgi:AcrR family transcriptional regulator
MSSSDPTAPDSATTPADERQVRQRLLDVTRTMLEEKGEQALRVVEVADAAGVSMGTIYSYFENRRALVAAVRLEQYRSWVVESLDDISGAVDALDTGGGPGAAVGALSQFVIVPTDPVARAHREVRVDAIAASHHEPELAASLQELHHDLDARARALVARVQEMGVVDPSLDPAAVALLLQAVPLGLALADLDPEHAPSPESWIALMTKVAGALLAPSPEG